MTIGCQFSEKAVSAVQKALFCENEPAIAAAPGSGYRSRRIDGWLRKGFGQIADAKVRRYGA